MDKMAFLKRHTAGCENVFLLNVQQNVSKKYKQHDKNILRQNLLTDNYQVVTFLLSLKTGCIDGRHFLVRWNVTPLKSVSFKSFKCTKVY